MLTKYAKADKSIREKLERKLKKCPCCKGYQPMGHDYKMYHCRLIEGEAEKDAVGISFVAVSRKPCTLEDIVKCPIYK